MPDWRNPEDYEYLRGYDLHEWAWEFLRRNPGYRQAYSALMAHGRPSSDDGPEKHQTFEALLSAATEPWGLHFTGDPDLPFRETHPYFSQQAGVQMLTLWESEEHKPGDLWPGYPLELALHFDLNYSAEIQIEIAAQILRECSRQLAERFDYRPLKPKTKNFRERQFPLYVRILDAELAGASIGEIGRELFKGKTQQRSDVKSMIATARQMVRQGYRDLLLLPPR